MFDPVTFSIAVLGIAIPAGVDAYKASVAEREKTLRQEELVNATLTVTTIAVVGYAGYQGVKVAIKKIGESRQQLKSANTTP